MINEDKYGSYTVEDFVWDERFREWVLCPGPLVSGFWADWLLKYPERESVILQAKEVVAALTASPERMSEQEKHELIARTLGRISAPVLMPVFSDAEKDKAVVPVRKIMARKMAALRYGLGAVAACLIVLGGVWLFTNNTVAKKTDYSYGALVGQSKVKLIEASNISSVPLLVTLSDGSTVTLQKNARISYAASFGSLDKREVYLNGDAFFNIRKDPEKPFSVYADGIITKVLGTSFKVKSDPRVQKVTVEVLTGKVEVCEQGISAVKPLSGKSNGVILKGNGVILLPNQKVVYSGEKNTFESTLVDDPVPVEKSTKGDVTKGDVKRAFLFEDAPLSDVARTIEATYGIEVEVENEAIYNCRFTGDISEQSLYRKLEAICQSTGTTYEIKETKIFIKGPGCNK